MAMIYPINLLTNTGQNVRGILNPKSNPLPPLTADTAPTFQLTFLESNIDSSLSFFDVSSKNIHLAIDTQNPKPENGHWYLKSDNKKTAPIHAQSNMEEVASIINASGIFPSGVTVKGSASSWLIQSIVTGVMPNIAGEFSGTTATSSLQIDTLSKGSETTHAAYRIQIIQAPALQVNPEQWTVSKPTPQSTLQPLTVNTRWLKPDIRAMAGFYTLSNGSSTTPPLSLDTSSYQLEKSIQSHLNTDSAVQAHPYGGHIIRLTGDLTINDSALVLPTVYTSNQELKSEGIYELLENANYADVRMEIRLTDKVDASESSFILPLVLQQPVIRDTPPVSIISEIQTSITIYNPYSNTWHELTASGSTLQVSSPTNSTGSNPIIIKHTSSDHLYTLHVGQNGSLITTYYGDFQLSKPADLKLKVDESNHLLVQATGSLHELSLKLTPQSS